MTGEGGAQKFQRERQYLCMVLMRGERHGACQYCHRASVAQAVQDVVPPMGWANLWEGECTPSHMKMRHRVVLDATTILYSRIYHNALIELAPEPCRTSVYARPGTSVWHAFLVGPCYSGPGTAYYMQ